MNIENPSLGAGRPDPGPPRRRGWGEVGFFTALFLALLLVFGRAFKNPPRSDHWSALYVFAQVGAGPEAPDWTSILTFDLWKHGTYRPLSHFVLFLEYKVFGTWFLGNHLLNFSMYFLSIVLLYRLAVEFGINRALAGAFLAVYAFLFSHFDIVTWTFQLFSTSSFSAVLLGFLLYIRFLKSGRGGPLILVGLLFMYGLLCSEVYVLWPFGLLFLTAAAPKLFPLNIAAGKKPWRACATLLGIIYLLYAVGFFLNRAATASTGPIPSLPFSRALLSVWAVFYNLLYTGIAGNLVPLIHVPINMYYNIELGGVTLTWVRDLPVIVSWVGGAGLVLTATGGFILYRKKKTSLLLILAFFLFLYFTNFFITTAGRLSTNHISYLLIQFRYHYVPNALVALMAAAAVDHLLRPKKREIILICGALLAVLFSNLFLVDTYVRIINNQLAPLKTLLSTIRTGLDEGLINPSEKLYIENGITRRLPQLCWNWGMAQFMQGSYQWFFSRKDLSSFTLNREEAAWIVREDDYQSIHRIENKNNSNEEK